MRKPAKPFVTEYKSRRPPQSAALFDASMIEELPSRDINADLPEIPDERRDHSYEEALKAAESVFGGGGANAKAAGEAPEAHARAILSDLSYEDPLEARLAAAASIKRGRKLGTKNKPKAEIMNEMPAPTIQAPMATAPAPIGRAAAPRFVVTAGRRPRVGFIKQLQAKRATKPGDKWKLKLQAR